MPARSGPIALAALLTATLGLAACGGGSSGSDRTVGAATTPSGATPSAPSGKSRSRPRHSAAPAAETRVVRAWAQTLAKGDVAGAARLFTVPTTVALTPGGATVRLRTRAQVEAFNRALPCRAEFVRAEKVGSYVDALFRLGGDACDAPGASARTAFLIRGGHIARWLRLPDESGENRSPSPTPSPPDGGGGAPPAPTSPAAPDAPTV